ncbi:MAG: hypothetical protein KKA62_00335, partial [Nanoarchaeota archaeon]|nr:hypothetical protein [Nanoarchaeota archaeon]
MKLKLKKTSVLLLISLIIISSFSLALNEGGEPTPEQIQSAVQNQGDFDNIQTPTAADLTKVENPTPEQFARLSPLEQGKYLGQGSNFDNHPEFVQKYYSDPTNWGLNAEADKVLFEGTRFRDLLKTSLSQVSAAEQYFSNKFPADFEFKEIGPEFKYDPNSGLLYNLPGKVNVKDTKIKTITAFGENNEFGIRVLGLDGREAVVIGEKEAGERLITFENGRLVLTDSQNRKQEFTFTGEETTKFNLKKDAIEIEGPVSVILPIDNEHEYARINNLGGKITISKNCNIEAENAIVETALIYLDGKFSYNQEKNIAEAFDHGDNRNGGYTIVVDKGSRLGAKTQGQNSPSKLTVHFSGVAPYSAFAPADPNAKPPENLKQVIEKIKNTKPPSPDLCTPSAGTSCQNAELYIDKDEFGRVIATAKGPVDVGFYNVAQGIGVTPSPTEPHFIGENGLSELDLSKGTMQVQINLRGKTTYTDNQYASYEGTGVKDGIRTREDGASVKIIRNEVNSEDVIYAECHQIGQGVCQKGAAAVDISKTIALATKAGVGIFTDPDYESVKISLEVSDDQGSLKYDWDEYKKNLGAIAEKQTDGKEMILGRTINMKSVVCEGNQECNLVLTQNKDGTAESFYELYDPQTKTVSKRVGIKTNLGKSYGQATILTSEKNIEKLQQMRDLIGRGAYLQIQQVFAKAPFEDDQELRNLVFKESGIDISKLGSKDYMDRIGTIAKYHTEAKNMIKSLSENYGIDLDEFGQPLTLEDQERLSDVMTKKRGTQGSVIFDQYTRAKVALANAEVQDKLAAHLACAGSSFCSVSDSDWKEAQKKLITEVKHRESSAEYKQWQDTVKKQEEAVKKAEEAAEYLGGMINKYATHISQTISGDLSTAELLGEEYRKARNQQGKFQDTEESNKNAEESKKVRLEAVNKNLENAKNDIGKFEEAAKTRALARKSAASKTGEIFKEITKDDWSEEDKHEYDLLRNTLASKEADVYALNLLSVNAPLNEYSALAGVQKLVDDCQGNSICEAEMWNAAGFSRKAADTVITADLPNSIKASLTDDYGFSAQQEVFDTLDESSQKYSDERKKTEELIKQGESGKIGTIFADYVQYLSEDEQVKLAQSIDKGDSKEIVTTLEKVQQKEQDSITSRVTAIASGKDAIKVAKSIMQRTGNEAAGNSILKSLPSELRETAEFKEADHLAAVISDERLKEKEQERIASAKALQNKREGRDSSMFDGVTWENSGVLEYATSKFLQGGGEVFDYVGEGLYDGGRYMVGYTSKGYGYAASAVGLESFGEGAIKAGEIIITEKETEEQKLDRDIQFFTDQAEEFRQAQLFINKQRAEGKTTVQALSALEGVTGDVSTSLALKNIARQGRRQLTANERGEEAFAEAEIAEREHGQYMVDGMYQNVIDIAAGQDEELTRRALEKLGESNEIIGIGGVGLTQRDAAIVVPLAKQIVLSVDNFIPGVLIAKAAKAGVKVARVIGEVSKISKAIEAVGDAAKLWKATEQAADLYRVSKAAVQEAEAVAKISKTAENIAKLEKAKESLKGAEAVLTVEKASQQTRLGKVLGREYYLGLTRKGEDLIAVEKAQKSLTTDLALITSKLDDARRSNAAPETINLLEQSSSALIKKSDDLDRATEALHLAGLDSVTEGRAGLKQYGLAIEAGGESKLPITIGLQRQSKLADDFQKARETFLAERIAVGADKVRPETINKLIETAKAREYDSITKTINSAIKTRLNAQRVGQNLDKLEQAGISVKFSEGKYVGEIAAGTSEARLLDSVNELIKDDEVLGRVVTGRIKEIPELAPAEADRLGSLSDELSEVTDVTIDGPSTLHVDPDTVPPGWEGTPAEFGDKAREYNALVAKADPGDIISEVRTGVEAQASTLANDKQVAALAVKDDLARRVSGESSTGVTAQVVGKEASELPKVRQVPDTEIMGDIPTPTSVEAGQRSAVLGSSDIGDIPLAGEPSKVLPLEKLPTAMTTPEQNAQRVVGLLPEVGQDVKVETVAGNVFEGTLKYSDEEMLYLEKFDEQQKILTSRVTEVEVPPKTVELEEVSLEGKVVNDNAFDPCNVAAAAIYGFAVPCVRPTPQIPLETRVLTPEDLPSSQITPEVLPIAEEIVPPPTARTADDFLVHYDLEGMNVEQRSGLQKWVTEAQGRFNDETIQQALPRQIEIFSGNPAKLSEEGKALESLVDAGYSPVEIRNAEKYLGEAKKLRDLPLQQGDLVHATTSDNALEIISSGQLKKSTGEGAQFGEGVYTVEAKASGKLKDVSAETSSYLSRTDITTGETSPVLVRVKPEYVDQHPPITKGATAQTRIFADDIPVEHLEFNSGQGWKSADEFVSSDKAAQLSKEMGDIPVTVDKSGKVSAEGLNLDDFQIVGEDVFSKSTGKKLSDEAAKVVLDEKQFLEFAPETIPFPGKVPEQLVQDNKLLFANREEFPALKGPQGRYSPFRFEDEDKQRLIAYSIEDRKVAEAAGKIFENVPASQLPSGQYTYVLLEDGTLVFGKVETELEFGVKHLHLANERPVVAAGEIVVEESGEYAFNSLSGTITKPLKDQQLEKFTAEVGSDLAQTKVTEYEQAVKDNMDSIFENYFGRKGDSTHVSVIGFEKESTLDELIDICAKNIGLNLPACGAQLDLKPLIDERVAALAAETVPAPIVSVTGTEIEISPSKFWQSEPLPLERRVELTPTEISREIETIKEGYASQKIDLEKIISNHPTVKVKQADVTFTGKLGEGTVGAVYEGSIPGVGDSLAFKTAKATPGELGRIRGNLADNVDSLFKELEQSREACKLVPCPGYYGIYEIDGVPYLVSDKVKGRHFFD